MLNKIQDEIFCDIFVMYNIIKFQDIYIHSFSSSKAIPWTQNYHHFTLYLVTSLFKITIKNRKQQPKSSENLFLPIIKNNFTLDNEHSVFKNTMNLPWTLIPWRMKTSVVLLCIVTFQSRHLSVRKIHFQVVVTLPPLLVDVIYQAYLIFRQLDTCT